MPHSQPHIQKLLVDRYYLRDETGKLLENDPKQLFSRVADAVADVEGDGADYWSNNFYLLMVDNKFLPNTPTLINAGKKTGVYAACNVLEIPDSMEGIFGTLEKAAIISKYGGGLGLYFGDLREENSIVKSTGQTSSGPISFMRVFDSMCDTVKQGGSRRGAMLAALPVWHPDIEKFISCKNDGSFSNFNISIVITDEFMKCVEANGMFELICTDNMRIGIDARDLWNKIVEHAHKTGDPGLIFIDEANRCHPLEQDVKCYNACGEQPLLHAESCVLGSINLMAYLEHFQSQKEDKVVWRFDWDALGKDIPTMVRFLDDIIDASPYPLEEVEKATKASRKIGLGIMGWADALIKMQIPYDSQEALDLAEKLMMFIEARAEEASEKLEKEKGWFPLWPKTKGLNAPRRNAVLTTIAPTGTISRIAGVSSSIEPIFAWNTHHKLVDLEYDEFHWSLNHVPEGTKFPPYMKTANEIGYDWHLMMQAAFQKHVGSSIAKTINLPNDAPVEDVQHIYMWAWKNKLKGITIYRDGSKDNQPLNKIPTLESYKDPRFPVKDEDIINQPSPLEEVKKSTLKKRGLVAVGPTYKIDTGKGKIYITVNYSEYHNTPVEVFVRLSYQATANELAMAEWAGRLISVGLKYGIPVDCIIKQGNKVFSDTIFWFNGRSFQSLPQLISYLLRFTLSEAMELAELDLDSMMDDGSDSFGDDVPLSEGEYCYDCGTYGIIHEGGCKVCQNCGVEKCGG
jgi:ribonucleoside-diphosphate reductase alpha chain